MDEDEGLNIVVLAAATAAGFSVDSRRPGGHLNILRCFSAVVKRDE